jgi:hypothetical protein
MVDQILSTVFSGTHVILNCSQVHMEKGSFYVTLKEFGLILIQNVLVFENLLNETISRNKVQQNFAEFRKIL